MNKEEAFERFLEALQVKARIETRKEEGEEFYLYQIGYMYGLIEKLTDSAFLNEQASVLEFLNNGSFNG